MSLEFIVFDLDNTLYARGSGVMEEIGRRIQLWLCRELGLTWEEASDLRGEYLRQHGTTMGGLMAEHGVEIQHYLDFVHDIPIEQYLAPDPALVEMLERIPLRKVIYTNATSAHAQRVLRALDALEQFECIIGIEEVGLHNKYNQEAYERMLELLSASGPECLMVEDSPRNLPPAKTLGMTTVLVGSERSPERVTASDDSVDFAVESVLEVEKIVKQLLVADQHGTSEDEASTRD
jgi:putative hydrolase of the HAD superfamily